jgi:hypothetical protein
MVKGGNEMDVEPEGFKLSCRVPEPIVPTVTRPSVVVAEVMVVPVIVKFTYMCVSRGFTGTTTCPPRNFFLCGLFPLRATDFFILLYRWCSLYKVYY